VDVVCSLLYLNLNDVILFTENSPRQVIVLIGTLLAGGRASIVYHNSSTKMCEYVVKQTQSKVIFVDSRERYEMVRDLVDTVVIMYDDNSWSHFNSMGRCEPYPSLPKPQPNDCCIIIYTSGTTGNPKGVMLSHDNLVFSANAHIENNPILLSEPMRVISHLPMSHIGALMNDVFVPLMCITRGQQATLFFSSDSLSTTLIKIRPTMLFCVPRLWERIENDCKKIEHNLDGFLHKSMKKLCSISHKNRQVGGSKFLANIDILARKYMRKHILEKIGLDKINLPLTGGAYTNLETLEYFGSIGFDVLGAYGMSELMGVQTVSRPDFFIDGYSGVPVEGTEVRIDDETGELCFRGRQVTVGYYGQSKKCVDENDWFHTGDVGEIHNTGHIKIIGRLDDLIITSTGHKIVPEPIETCIRNRCDDIENVLLVGHGEKYLGLLLSMKVRGDISRATEHVEYYNNHLSNSKSERIQKVILFTIEANDLTASNKIKRGHILKRYKNEIRAMYF
jgi:long-chain-fatty-acid--CoA ligase ACSBG